MNCSKCGTAVKDGQKFCVICGTPCGVPVRKLCVKCGSELMDGARFCLNCGEPVQTAPAPVQNAQPDTATAPVQPVVSVESVQEQQKAFPSPEQPAQYKTEKPKAANTRRNIIILVIVLVLLLAGAFVTMFAVSASEEAKLVDMLSLAERYLDEQNYDQAIIEFERLLDIDPQNADAYIGLAAANEATGDYEKARQTLTKALDIVSEEDAELIADALEELGERIEETEAEQAEDDEVFATVETPVIDTIETVDEPVLYIDPMEIVGMRYEDAVVKYDGVLDFVPMYEYDDSEQGTIFEVLFEGSDNIVQGSAVEVRVSEGPEPVMGFTPGGNAGTVTFLGYYDITLDAKGKDQYDMFSAEAFGGEIEWISSSAGSAYFEKLATMIAADDSPDIVTFEQLAFPYGVSRNMFTALDDYIDKDSELWADMKPYIEAYGYEGKHYYYPHMVSTMYALNYNRRTVEEAGLPDPYELYMNGEWTWSAWQSVMEDFCAISDENIGYYAVSTMLPGFVNTTGQAVIAYDGSTFSNNCSSALTNTAMDFLNMLDRSGLFYPDSHPYGDWVSPQVWAPVSDKILFLMMEPEWTYIAATEQVQNFSGVDNDICGVVSDFAFVPLPRYDDADAYYNTVSTFGYMIPNGADNIEGAVEWINLNRMFDTDENIRAQQREACVSPTPVYYKSGKYEGREKWQITWDAEMYDLLMEMRTPSAFALVNEQLFGFNEELSTTVTDGMYNCADGIMPWEAYSDHLARTVDETISVF